MGSGPGAPRRCHVLLEDADLGEAVPLERHDQAVEDCTAPEIALGAGAWTSPPALGPDGIGFLILRGVMLRRVAIDGRHAVELLGECDLVRPWQHEDAQTIPLRSGWTVIEPARLAVLDGRFTRQLGRHPELAGRLFERAIRRSRRLVINMAIIHQARVDDRLHLLLWHFAGRWGRVRGDGVVLPLRLTHAVLADFVAARRPTVTSALSELARRGLIRTVDEGWLLIGEAPRDLQLVGAATAGAQSARDGES